MSLQKVYVGGFVEEEVVLEDDTNFGEVLKVKVDTGNGENPLSRHITCTVVDDGVKTDFYCHVHQGDFILCEGHMNSFESVENKICCCPECRKEEPREHQMKQALYTVIDSFTHFWEVPKGTKGINTVLIYGGFCSKSNIQDFENQYAWAKLILDRPTYVKDSVCFNGSIDPKYWNHDYLYAFGKGEMGRKLQKRPKKGKEFFVEGQIVEFEQKEEIPFHCKNCGARTNFNVLYNQQCIYATWIYTSLTVFLDKEKAYKDYVRYLQNEASSILFEKTQSHELEITKRLLKKEGANYEC